MYWKKSNILQPAFRSAIYTEGLLEDFVNGLHSSSSELVQFCAKAIYMVRDIFKSVGIFTVIGIAGKFSCYPSPVRQEKI